MRFNIFKEKINKLTLKDKFKEFKKIKTNLKNVVTIILQD